ncbi:MAG: hypothetical protein JXR23_06375, partial [Pontiellaceae bacterium]|nr:hypothetical protein [Pontiellaceae bacterium]
MGWAKVFVVSGLLVSLCSAQDGGRVELSGKAADYYQILLKRPRPGNLFDRFCNSWLEENDLAKLEAFLSENTEPNARHLLAFYYERMRESKKASDLYGELIAGAPDDVDLVFYKAGVDADMGFYEQAAEDIGKLVDRENVDEELLIKALKLQGRCLLRIGKKQEGLAVWQRLLEVSGMDEDVADELTDLLMAEGFYEEALAQCDRMLETERDAYRKVMLRMRRATLLVRMDRRKEAIDGLCEAFASTGQGSWLQRDLLDRIETLYRTADDLMGLANCCEGMLLRWPDNPELRRAYAGSLLACRKDEEALEVARELIRLVPDSQEIKEWYVGVLQDLDRYDEAAAMLEGFLERFPDDNALRLQLASIHQLREDDPKTIEYILAYLEHSKQEAADYLMAARTLARYDLNDEATTIFLEMLGKWPDSLEGREAVAMHMSRKSYLHLELAWKHYEWLAKACDLETLLRLDSALKAARRPDWALNLLDMRSADFSGEYRYASARYETIASMENPEGLLEQGLRCVDLAGSIEEIQSSVATLLYEVKKQALINEWIERFSSEEPLAPARLWLLASLHVANRQVEQADGLLRDAMESNPGNEDIVLFRLQLARQERNWDLAENLLVHLIEQFPARQSIWIRELVPVLSQAGRHEKALEWIEEWKKVSPNAIRPYEMERDALLASGKPEMAVQQMRKAVLQFSESKDLKRALGRLYESTGRTKDAEELYWTMLDAEEDLDNRMSLLSDIIAIKQSMGGMNDLIRELERRAETARTAAFPLLGLAECYRINNRINERSAILGQLLELRPSDLAVLRAKAGLEEDLGNYDAARNLMQRIADEETTGAAFRKLVEFEAMYGDPALAAGMMDDPRLVNDLDSFVELATRFAALGIPSVIDAQLTRVMEEYPEDYRLTYLHGINLGKEGKAEEAFRIFAELIQLEDVGEQTNSPSSRPTARTEVQRLIQSGSSVFGYQYSAVSAQWQLQYGAFIPQGLIQMVSLATQEANNGMISSSRSSSTIQRIDVPDNLDELHSMCALQLLETSRKLPEDVRPELDAYLPYAAIMHIDSIIRANSVEWWNAVEALYPEDEAVHLFRMLAAPHTIEPNGENMQMVERLAAEYPEMAFQFLTQFIGWDPQLLEQLPDLIRSIGLDDAHLDVAFELAMRALQFIPQNGSIPAGLKELVDEIVTRIEAREGLDDAYRIRLIAVRARMNGDFEPLLAELKIYLQRLENETAIGVRASSVSISFGGILSLYFYSGLGLSSYSRNNVSVSFYSGLEETSFPPYRLPDGNSINLSFSPESIGMDRQQFFDSLADWSSDSLFGWFTMARMGAESNLLQQVADTVAAKEDKTRNELYALLCWHVQQKEMEQALACALELCDQAGDDPAWKATFDRLLLRVLAQVEEIPESIRPALAERAESLWDSVWIDSSMSFQLVEMMEELELPLDGLLERAQQLVAQNASSSLVSRSVTRSSAVRKEIYQQVVEQFDRGETESALIRVAVMLRSEALKTLYPSGTQSQSNYQLRNCIQHILHRNLADAFLAQFEPPEGSVDARRKYEYAYALETMGRSGDAFPLYREVYSIRPDWVGAKIRYCAGLIPTDREAATALLRELEPGQAVVVFNMLQEAQNTGEQQFEERLAYIEMMRAMMDDLQQIERNYGYNFIYTIHNQLSTQWYGNVGNNSLPSLFDATEAGSLAPGWEIPKDNLSDQAGYWRDDQLAAMQQRRRECYIDLLKAICASSEQYGLDAFEKLTAYLDFSKATVDDEELFQLARSALKQASSYNSYSSSEMRGTGKTALEYYVMELHRRQDWSDAEQLVEQMPGSLMRQPLQNLLTLQQVEDKGGFAEAFGSVLGRQSIRQGTSGPTWPELALRMYYLDGGDKRIDDIVWQIVEKRMTGQNMAEGVALINAWVGAEHYAERPIDIEDVYSRVVQNVFSDEEMEVFAKASPGSIDYNNHSSIYQKYQQLASVFSQTPLPPEAIRTVLASTAQFDNKMRESSLSQYLANANRNDMVDFDWLRRVGFLDDWDTFPFQFFTGGQQSFASRIINQLRGNNRNEILKELENPDSQGFGKTVLATLMKSTSSNRRATELLSALAPYREPLEADPERRNLLFGWIQDALLNNRGMLVQEDFSKPEDNASLLELYSTWSQEALLAQLPAVESMKLSALARDSYTELREAGRIMRALAQTDLERAQALCNRLMEMSRIYYAINGQQNAERNTLQSLFNEGGYTDREFQLAATAVAGMKSPEAQRWFTEQYCSSMFSRASQRYQERGMPYQQARLEAAKDCIRAVSGIGGEIPFSAYFRWLQQIDQQSCPALASWIEKMDDKPSPLNLVVVLLNPTAENSDQIQAYLMDEKNAVEDRLQVYTWLSQRFSDRLPMLRQLEFNQAMIKLYDGVDNVRVPQQMYRILLEQVISLEAGEERDAWVDRLLGLWKDEKVDGTQYDTYNLSKLLEVAATAGRLDELRVSMENQNMQSDPMVYAMALRQGWYDWVAERLPNNIRNMNGRYLGDPDMWIPADAVEHFEAILESIKSDESRAVVRLFLSVLPVKGDDGNAAVDKERVEGAFELADETLEDPGLIQWVIGQYATLRPASNLPKLKQSILKSRDMNLIQQIFEYGTFSEGDFEVLASAVAEMDFPDLRQWFTERYCSSMFSRAYQRYQESGMPYQKAQLEAAKDCIRAVSGIGDGVPLATYLRWLQQINQQSYPALASWIEKMDDKPSPLDLLVVLLDPTGNTDQIQAYV